MESSQKSLKGLDLVNVFMADVRDGVGVYLSVYLLTEHKWDPSTIGFVVAVPFIISLIAQSPMGHFIDQTRKKRLLLVVASALVALSCLTVVFFPGLYPIVASQVLLGFVQTIFAPTVAAISLGMVGHRHLSHRIGRNESFNHAGNMLAAVVAVFIGWYISYEGIFYFSVFQCAAIILSILLIREKDIDHDLARAGAIQHKSLKLTEWKELFSDKNVIRFTFTLILWHAANGTMLPLVGQKLGITTPAHSALYLSICIIIAQTVMIGVAPLAARWAEKGRKNIFFVSFLFIPLRAILFAVLEDKYLLMAAQIIDGLGAGIFGVVSILMMADLSRGSGHFSLLQGAAYTAIGIGIILSSIAGGFIVSSFGYTAAFLFLALVGIVGSAYFWFATTETLPRFSSSETSANLANLPH